MNRNNQEWRGKSRGGAFGYNFFIWLIKRLGISAAYAFLGLVVLYFIPFSPKSTRSIWYYARNILDLSLFNSSWFIIKNYYRFGQILIDKTAIGIGLKEKYRFQFDNYEAFLNILNSGKGVVIIGAHVGNWESGAPFFEDYREKINIVLYDAEHEKIKEAVKKSRQRLDYKIIAVNTGDISHVLRIREALAGGEYVCFQGDRVLPAQPLTGDKVLARSFMGKDALFPQGPFLLASRLKVPVVFHFAMREPERGYRFYFYPVEAFPRNSTEELLDIYIEKLESIMGRYPEQWFNYYRFWQS